MLSTILLAHLPDAASRDVPADLEARLVALVSRARGAWPEVALPVAGFLRHVARHLPADRELGAALGSLRVEDLYLAWGCAGGDPAALRAFEQQHLSRVPGYLRGMGRDPQWVDEVAQVLRTLLLLPGPDRPPRITEYGGRGALRGFVQVSAVRTARSMLRRREERPGGAGEEELEQALAGPEDPELRVLRQRYGTSFRQAFLDALGTLSAEQRGLLRLHFAEGLSLQVIGAMYGVNKSTVSRWLASARAVVFDETLRLLGARLQVESEELRSLTRLLQSQLDISITGALRERGE